MVTGNFTDEFKRDAVAQITERGGTSSRIPAVPGGRKPGSGLADPQPAASFSKSRATASAPGSLCPASFDAAI